MIGCKNNKIDKTDYGKQVDETIAKFSNAELKSANVTTIRDILEHAEIYDEIYHLKNITNIKRVNNWIQVFINNKEFELQYAIRCYQYRVDGRYVRKNEVVDYLVDGLDETAESFKNLAYLYIAIKRKYANTLELFKEAVDKSDWTYMYSDDNGCYWGGERRQERLKKLAEMLGNEAITYLNQQRKSRLGKR